ncbi:DEAD/DEAH box helicase family protein [Acetonema longum]|uniref:type I site-specific deoxyribonuclease n=1 Tax=Acetonema longum DSM 6540 TaxID=1009370 RepID=F7NGI1_9FIRM|nr:DEAD/DEAH box helicase family protein [Acetonema longum]EGO64785.1 HsdR family type I site-specific deoxyribonuclease [Acetonema longum DSM 6540]
MSQFYKRHAGENPWLSVAADASWTYVEPAEALLWRGGPGGLFFKDILAGKLKELNPGAMDQRDMLNEIITRFDRLPTTLEGSRLALSWLKGELTGARYFSRRVRLIDFDHPDNNVYHMTNNWQYSGLDSDKSELVLLVNGIPVSLIAGQSSEDPDRRVRLVERFISLETKLPHLFKVLQLILFPSPERLWLGLPFQLESQGLTWRKPAAGQEPAEWLSGMFAPARILGLLRHLLFIKTDDRPAKLALRQYQAEAVEQALQGVRQALRKIERKQRGLFYLAQGSGKTLTIMATAARLLSNEEKLALSVLIFADPNEIDTGMLPSMEGPYPVRIAGSAKELQAVLASDYRGLLISPREFATALSPGTNERENVIVLVDEAQRIFTTSIADQIEAALPNAILIGCTGSPSAKTDKIQAVSLYDAAQALTDRILTTVCYDMAPPAIRVQPDTLYKEFIRNPAFEGSCDICTLNCSLEMTGHLAAAVKNRERVEQAAEYIARHFTEKVQPFGRKAILVAYDKEACGLYKKALDKHLPAGFSQVIYSAGRKDSLAVKEYYRTTYDEQRLRKAFAQTTDAPHILILTDKLLTGFHCPDLNVLYLDKPLRDHILVQVLSRINQSGNKEAGVVVDLLGLFDAANELTRDIFPDGLPGLQPLEAIHQQFGDLIRTIGLHQYADLVAGPEAGQPSREQAVEYFLDDSRRQAFFACFRQLQSWYDLLHPSALLMPYLTEYKMLAQLYGLVYNAYNTESRTEFTVKTAGLFPENRRQWMKELPGTLAELNEAELDKWKSGPEPATIKVIQMWKFISNITIQPKRISPEQIMLREQTDWLVQLMQSGQKNPQEALTALSEMVGQYLFDEQLRRKAGIDTNVCTLYKTLKTFTSDLNMKRVSRLDAILRRNPDYLWNPRQFARVHTDLCLELLPLVGPDRFVDAANTVIYLPRTEIPGRN